MSEKRISEMYRKPEKGEDHLDYDLPIGWLLDYIDVPDEWEVEFVERGGCLRFWHKVDREKYGVKPPGWPGVGITSGSDFLAIVGDTDRVIRDVWHDPDDTAEEVAESVQESISAVKEDLERVRLQRLLEGTVPDTVVENLIDKFETVENVFEASEDKEKLQSVGGVGPVYAENIKNKLSFGTQIDDTEITTEVYDNDES